MDPVINLPFGQRTGCSIAKARVTQLSLAFVKRSDELSDKPSENQFQSTFQDRELSTGAIGLPHNHGVIRKEVAVVWRSLPELPGAQKRR